MSGHVVLNTFRCKHPSLDKQFGGLFRCNDCAAYIEYRDGKAVEVDGPTWLSPSATPQEQE